MEGFPKDSEKFLKKSSDFNDLIRMSGPTNDNFPNDVSRMVETGRKRVEERVLKGAMDKEFIVSVRKRLEAGEITAEYAMSLMSGISEDFLKIYTTSQEIELSLNQDAIRGFKKQYSEWTADQILAFVNNPANLAEFKKRPTLVIALGSLLE